MLFFTLLFVHEEGHKCTPVILYIIYSLDERLRCSPKKVFFANYGNGRQISNTRLRCSANHSALSQLANQSPPSVSEGGAL